MFGRQSTHVIVRSHHPRLRQVLLMALILMIAASGWLLFDFGRKRAGFDSREAKLQVEMLRGQIIAAEADNRRLSTRIVALEQAADIDRHAYDEVTRSLSDLEHELLELRSEVGFYRGIVSSEDDSISGLKIRTLKLRQDVELQSYQFRLILSQIATTNARIQGHAELVVSGSLDDEAVELSHKDLLGENSAALQFNLRHFQELRGQLTLPAGFVPARLMLKVIPSGTTGSPQERSFNWSDLVS